MVLQNPRSSFSVAGNVAKTRPIAGGTEEPTRLTHTGSTMPRKRARSRSICGSGAWHTAMKGERGGGAAAAAATADDYHPLRTPQHNLSSHFVLRLRQERDVVSEGREGGRPLFCRKHYSQPGELAASPVRRREEVEGCGGRNRSYVLLLFVICKRGVKRR